MMPKKSTIGRRKTLNDQTREVIRNVLEFMTKEAEALKFLIEPQKVMERVAAATGVSERTVRRIKKEAMRMKETSVEEKSNSATFERDEKEVLVVKEEPFWDETSDQVVALLLPPLEDDDTDDSSDESGSTVSEKKVLVAARNIQNKTVIKEEENKQEYEENRAKDLEVHVISESVVVKEEYTILEI